MPDTGRSRGLYLFITGTAVRAGGYVVQLVVFSFTHEGLSFLLQEPSCSGAAVEPGQTGVAGGMQLQLTDHLTFSL